MTTVLAVLVTAAVIVIAGMTAYMIRRNRGLPARALVHYDPDAADASGSTARRGVPCDPFGLTGRREMEADLWRLSASTDVIRQTTGLR